MDEVFADSGYWIALIASSRRTIASKGTSRCPSTTWFSLRIVTSELVLVEFLNHMSRLGSNTTGLLAFATKQSRTTERIPTWRYSVTYYQSAVLGSCPDHYGNCTLDQRWSLVDCIQFPDNARARAFKDALDATTGISNSAGFAALLRDD